MTTPFHSECPIQEARVLLWLTELGMWFGRRGANDHKHLGRGRKPLPARLSGDPGFRLIHLGETQGGINTVGESTPTPAGMERETDESCLRDGKQGRETGLREEVGT